MNKKYILFSEKCPFPTGYATRISLYQNLMEWAVTLRWVVEDDDYICTKIVTAVGQNVNWHNLHTKIIIDCKHNSEVAEQAPEIYFLLSGRFAKIVSNNGKRFLLCTTRYNDTMCVCVCAWPFSRYGSVRFNDNTWFILINDPLCAKRTA